MNADHRRSLPKRRFSGPLGACAICCSVLLASGCHGASAPLSESGVRAMYRSIGIEASAGNFGQICSTYTDQRLRAELSPPSKKCYTRTFERWAEKVRLSKVTPATAIIITGREATVYDGRPPEQAVYVDGEWRLAIAPEIESGG